MKFGRGVDRRRGILSLIFLCAPSFEVGLYVVQDQGYRGNSA